MSKDKNRGNREAKKPKAAPKIQQSKPEDLFSIGINPAGTKAKGK